MGVKLSFQIRYTETKCHLLTEHSHDHAGKTKQNSIIEHYPPMRFVFGT